MKKRASWKLKGFKHLTCYKYSHNNTNCVYSSFVRDYLYWHTFALHDRKKPRMALYALLTIIYLSLFQPFYSSLNSTFYFSCKWTSHHWDQSSALPNSEFFFCTRSKKTPHTFILFSFCLFKSWYLVSTTKAHRKKRVNYAEVKITQYFYSSAENFT